MRQAERKDFRRPDEIREFPKGRVELIRIGEVSGVLRILMDDFQGMIDYAKTHSH